MSADSLHNNGPRPRYERPMALPLGELATGWGQSCLSGSTAVGECTTGSNVSQGSQACSGGTLPITGHCRTGTTPPKKCQSGTDK